MAGAPVPWSIRLGNPNDCERAAKSLSVNGFCVLRGPVVAPAALTRCAKAVWERLDQLMQAAFRRGLDIDKGALRFNELMKRPGPRYDLRLPLGGATKHVPFDTASVPDADSWTSILPLIDAVVQSILPMMALPVSRQRVKQWSAAVAGCVVAMPGAPRQPSHVDGEHLGLVNCFVPLVQVTARNGPTEICPGSHQHPVEFLGDDGHAPLVGGVAPDLEPGDILLFHYRVVHRGLGNQAEAARPVLYFTYGAAGETDTRNFPTDQPLL